MINFSWEVKYVEVYPSYTDQQDPPNTKSNVVHKVNWRLKGIDNENNDPDGIPFFGEIFGDISIDVSNLSSFIEFDDLSKSQVQTWVESAMGSAQVQEWKDEISSQISDKINPSSVQKIIED